MQGCLQKESGPSCYCNDGFILAINQKNCQDINECSEFGICSQRCTNTQGSYQCSCFPGYTNINGSCLATSGETLLLFSTKTEVRGVDLTNNRYFSVAKSLPHVIGVAYDGKEKRVYWTDVQAGRETIVSSQLDGSTMKTLVTSGLDMPEDLVVDEVNRNIYFTDSIAKHIGVCSLRDPISCAVLETDVEQPRAIVVHHDMMQVLFTDWGSSKKCIGVLGMDGTNRRNLVTEGLEWPNGLALDDALDRVFWADAKLDIVESIRLDGSDRRIVLDSIVKHPFSLAVFEDRLYWSDRENKDVVSCNKFTGKNLITHVKELGVQPYGINVFNPIMVKNLTSPCWPINPCSHLCLPSMKSYICRCPAHLKLNSDKKTCSVSTDATTFLIATSRSLYQAYPQSVGKDEFTLIATLDDGLVGNLAGNSLDNTVMVLTKKLHGVDVIGILDRNNKKVINILSSSFAGSIAFDPRSKTVFWTDFKKMSVMAQSLVRQEPVEIASDLDTPLSLLVVPKHNRLLVGELGRLSLLKLGPQKSSERQVISTALNLATCLAYDPSLDTVFIGDAGSRIIFRWDWGKSNLVPFKQNIGEVIDIAIKDNLLYWVEKGKDVLFWTSSTTNTKEVSWMSLSTIAGVRDHLRISFSGNNSGSDYNTGCLESPCSHLCIPGEGVNDFTCSCPFGMVLNKDKHSCRQDCPGDVFSCGDGQCIHQSWKCDGVGDCKNKADEANCTTKSVQICDNSTQVTCDNGECLPKDWWCDGDNDCTDGSDENAACPAIECDKGKFQCKDGKQCVVDRWRCDGDFDCRDESDETECGAVSCLASQFACKDGLKCLQHSWICDGTADCHDGSDEINCTLSSNDPKCSSTEFRCSNGDCIDLVLVCDGQQDCWDKGDESEQICHNRDETEVLVDDVNCSGGFKVGGTILNHHSECYPSAVRCPLYVSISSM